MKYNTIAEVTDLGPFISKIVLETEQSLSNCEIEKDAFQVYVSRKDKATGKLLQLPKEWGSTEFIASQGERRIKASYLSDQEGRPSQIGSCITLELEVDPRMSLGATIAFNGSFNVQVDCDYMITQIKPIKSGEHTIRNMVFSELNNSSMALADQFITGESINQGIRLGYATYQPEKNGSKRPLIIWLHGAGEGGTDPMIAVIGNKVVHLVSDHIQQYFGGSYVLAPQAPTMWMDDGTGQYTTDGSSMYVECLMKLIEDYMETHDDIDRDRIYIGGCSNGGFMTMKMIITYPQVFAAAFPICEALSDQFISAKDINRIKNIPIWFTHADNDPIVDIEKHTGATFRRLLANGADNVHFSCFPSVIDQTGRYFDQEGKPYEYHGHFSWIPALNDECIMDYNNHPVYVNGKEVTLFQWLSMQTCK